MLIWLSTSFSMLFSTLLFSTSLPLYAPPSFLFDRNFARFLLLIVYLLSLFPRAESFCFISDNNCFLFSVALDDIMLDALFLEIGVTFESIDLFCICFASIDWDILETELFCFIFEVGIWYASADCWSILFWNYITHISTRSVFRY